MQPLQARPPVHQTGRSQRCSSLRAGGGDACNYSVRAPPSVELSSPHRSALTSSSHALPSCHPRHPGSPAEAHPDDLAVCGARAEPPALPGPGVLPSAYLSTATGVFCDNPAPEPEPGGATRLPGPGPTPRTPALTEVPLSPPSGSAPAPAPTPVTRHPQPISGEPSAPKEDQRCQEATRESEGAANIQSVSRPAGPTLTSQQTAGGDHPAGGSVSNWRHFLQENGLRCCDAV